MGENLSSTEDMAEKTIEQKEKIYSSLSEYLSVFEESPQFNEALTKRENEIREERIDLKVSQEELIIGMRMAQAYRFELEDFYRAGNKLSIDLNVYREEAQKAIEDYWNFLKSIPNHITLVRATAKDKEDEEMKLFRMDKTRDRFHTLAGLALLGDGVTLANSQRITCDEIAPNDERAMPLKDYSVLGRTLVSIITEENGLDIVDPEREEKKTAATLDFLNYCHYSNGHWVRKGER